MTALRLLWLGAPTIEGDGRLLQLEMRKPLALLAYLSLSAHNPTREKLATLFWPEYDQQHAQANLRRNLASLARSLPAGLLAADREKIGLRRPKWLRVDVEEFHQQLFFASQHPHNVADPVCPDCLPYLEKAIALYRGAFFDGFTLKDCPEFDEWQFFKREGLQSEYAEAVEKLSAYYASLSQWEKSISLARSWVSFDRLNESAQHRLISLLARSGQRLAAQRQYDELVRILQEELNQKPEEETVELVRNIQLKAQEPPKVAPKLISQEPIPTRVLEPLLKTKLYIPFSKGEKVYRGKMVSKLNQVQEHALTVISAPAGYGKTTALSEWIKQCPWPVGWLSLDDADNHQVRFLTYLIAALQSIDSGIGEETLALLQSPQPVPARLIVSSLIHEFERLSQSFVLVLDDYQSIHSESIHELLASLFDHLPNNAHLIISTRADPPFNLARLRAQSQLLEIRSKDLRFTIDEALAFFNEIMKLEISPENVAILDERTEGWAVGLQMAALSLQRNPDKSKAIQAFSASNRYILDYLLEEVMERQPKLVQEFLLQTSVLREMNGALCDSITKISEWSIDNDQAISGLQLPVSSQQILEHLERSNLFILSLDDERCWYRYHHLFSELLQSRLEHLYPSLVQSLHRRACDWYEKNGLIPAAVRHALASKAFDYSAGVIERAIGSNLIWGSGDLALLMSWVDALPTEILNKNPLLRIYLCAALYVTGEFKKSSQILDELEKFLPEILKTVSNPILIEQLFLNLCVLLKGTEGNISGAIEDSLRSRALASGDELANSLGMNYLLLAYLVAGDVENALRIAHASYETLSKRGFALQAISNVKNTAEAYILQGRLIEAVDVCRQEIEHGKLSHERNPIVGILGFPIGAVLLERNELEMAENYVQEGLDLNAKGPLRNDFGQGYALLAMIKQAQGDRKHALQLIDQALQIAQHAEIPRLIQLIQAYRARIWLAQGEINHALEWASAYRLIGPTEYPREVEDLTVAQVLILQKQCATACELLGGLLSNARTAKRDGRVIEILALLSLAYLTQNRVEKAMGLFEETLQVACREGYTRVYLEKGEPMRKLINLYIETHENENIQQGENDLLSYANKLLVAFEKE